MDTQEIKHALETLTNEKRREICIFLTHLELKEDASYFETLRERMNDQLAQSWKDLEELD